MQDKLDLSKVKEFQPEKSSEKSQNGNELSPESSDFEVLSNDLNQENKPFSKIQESSNT